MNDTNSRSNIIPRNRSRHRNNRSIIGHSCTTSSNNLGNHNKRVRRTGFTSGDLETEADSLDEDSDPDEGAADLEAFHGETGEQLADGVDYLVTTLQECGAAVGDVAGDD